MTPNENIGQNTLTITENQRIARACDAGIAVALVLCVLTFLLSSSTEIIAERLLIISTGLGITLLFPVFAGSTVSRQRKYYGIITICILGLAARILFLSTPGTDDLLLHEIWSRQTATEGIVSFYQEQFKKKDEIIHPPLTVLVLEGVGYAYRAFVSQDFHEKRPMFRMMLRIPAIIADLMTVVLLYALIRKYYSNLAAHLAAITYALHPAIIYTSTIWGQNDSLFTLLLLMMLTTWLRRHWFLVGAMFALAFLAKAQAVILLPLLILLCILHRNSIWKIFLGGLTTTIVFTFVFLHGNVVDILPAYTRVVGGFSQLSLNAYNLWWALFGSASWKISSDSTLFGLSYRTIGFSLYGLAVSAILWSIRRLFRKSLSQKNEFQTLMIGSSLLVYAFFLFNAEMHERYIFPFMVFGLPLLFIRWRFTLLYIIASLGFFFNLTGVYHHFTTVDIALTHMFPNIASIISVSHIIVFFYLLRQFWEWGKPDLQQSEHEVSLLTTMT